MKLEGSGKVERLGEKEYKEIFSKCMDKDFRYTYADFYARVCKLANVLKSLGIKQGDKEKLVNGKTFL